MSKKKKKILTTKKYCDKIISNQGKGGRENVNDNIIKEQEI